VTLSGALPQGVTFTKFSGGGGFLGGTPAAGSAGTYNLTFTAHNGAGSDATQNFTLVVGPMPAVNFATIPDFTAGLAGSFTITTNGNNPPLTLTEQGALPAGVTFGDNGDGTATVQGVPAAGTGGFYSFSVTASNGITRATQFFDLTVDQAPVITSAASATFVPGAASAFTIVSTGTPAAQVMVNGLLPAGITVTANPNGSATLSGTPAAGTNGTYDLSIDASNGIGDDASQDFILTVGSGLAITSSPTGTLTAGQSGSLTITASGSATPTLTFSGPLPAGVTFKDNGNGTATLGGNAATGATYNLVLTAHDGVDPDVSQEFTLTVNQAPQFTTPVTGGLAVGQPFGGVFISAIGFPLPSLSMSGTLPKGVTFSNFDGSGDLFGTPAAGTEGTYPLVFTAHNGIGNDATQNFTLTVGDTPSITSGNSATFTVGQSGTFTVKTSGSPAPALNVLFSNLPSGVTFQDNGDGTGTLSGTPAAGTGGTYTLDLQAKNVVGFSTAQFFTLTVDQGPQITSNAAATFLQGQSNTFAVTTQAFPAAKLTETGSLPTGVSLNDLGTGTAFLQGTPAAGSAGSYPITITADGGSAGKVTQSFTLTVQQGAGFTSSTAAGFSVGQSGNFTVTSAGTPTDQLTERGSLPPGVTFHDNGDGTATLAGTPAAGTGGAYLLTLTAHNGVTLDGVQNLLLFVTQAPAITSAASATLPVGLLDSFTVTTTGAPAPSLTETGTLPGGVTFTDNGDGTATISGFPTASGNFNLTLTAHNGAGSDATQTFNLVIGQPILITSNNAATFTTSQAGSFTVTATGTPTPSLAESGAMPSGLSFHDNGDGTATLSGTPSAGTGDSYALTITGHNGVVGDTTQSFTLSVDQPAAITSTNATTFVTGQAGSFAVTTTGFPAPSLSASGALPSGVTFTDNGDGTATLGGTPAAGTGKSYTLTLTAHNSVGGDFTQSFTLTVHQPAAITSNSATTFTTGQSGSFTVTATGAPTPSLAQSGGLPSGVSFHDNGNGTATLTGTPAAGSGGTYSLTLTAHNGVGSDFAQSFTLTVDQPAAITSGNAVGFTTGQAGSFTVTTTGTPAPSLAESGALPSGVSFTDNGDGTATFGGTPTANGTYNLTLTAHNGVGSDFTQSFTLTVGQPAAITSDAATTLHAGQAGTFTVTATGQPTPSLAESGTLPSGVSFHDNGDGTATLAGTPAAGTGKTYALTLTAHNGIGSDFTQSFSLTVDAPPTISSASAATFTIGKAGNFTVTTTGFPAAALSESGVLPSGVTFTDNGDGTGSLKGTPAATTGAYTFAISATNGLAPAVTQVFTLTVNDPPTITILGPSNIHLLGSPAVPVGQMGGFLVKASGGLPGTITITKTGALPSGLTFKDNGNGNASVVGVPLAGTAGSYPLIITATNPGGQTQQAVALIVYQPVAFTGSRTASFTVGRAGSFAITTTGYPAAQITAGSLPNGLTFTDNGNGTATISGMPAAGSTGTYTPTISATNVASISEHQTVGEVVTLTVYQAPAFSSGNSATFTVGQAGTFNITTTAGVPSTTTVSTASHPPTGVSFTAGSGGTATLSGTPVAGTGGTYSLTLVASNGPTQTTQAFTLTVRQAPAITSAPTASFTLGQPGTFTVKTTGFPNDAISAGALPSGLSFTDNGNGTATISGTPAAGTLGAHSVNLTASNGVGSAAGQILSINVNQAPAFTSGNSATFTVGQAGTFNVTTTPGVPTATTVSTASHPPRGVTFVAGSGGKATLSGTPLAGTGGTYSLTLVASNGPAQATQSFTLTVDQAPAFTSAKTASFTLGQVGSFTVTTTGFPKPTLGAGTLPGGLSFTDNGNGTGTISGTPAAGTVGAHAVNLTGGNGVGSAAGQTLTITVNQAPAFTSGNSATFMVGQASTFNVTTSPGVPATTTVSTASHPPTGVTFTAGSGGTATIKGTPAAGTGGTYTIAVVASNVAAQATQTFTLTVDQVPAFTSAKTASFTVGQTASFTISTTGFPRAVLGAGALPGGLTFTDNGNGTATISGTPALGTAGNYVINLTAGNGTAPAATQALALTVGQPPLISSTANATFTATQPGNFTVTTTGFPAGALSKVGNLPSGVTFTDNGNGTASLKGTPAAGTGGTYTIVITASNGVLVPSRQLFTLTVDQAPAFTSAAKATLVVGKAGSFTISTAGFPVAALGKSGNLPAGVTFTDNGNGTATLSGTPAAGSGASYALVLTANNGVFPAITQNFTLTVNQAPAITSAATTTFTAGQNNSFTVTTTGFPAATLTKTGTLPAGVTLVSNGDGTATLKGQPAAGTHGTFAFTITASDGVLPNAMQSFVLKIVA
jgi:hypothetical protein